MLQIRDIVVAALVLGALHLAVQYGGMRAVLLQEDGGSTCGAKGVGGAGLSPDLTVTYFGIRGRAEPIRLYLEAHGIQYNNRMLSKDEWAAEKAEHAFGKYKFGQLPHLQNGDHSISQMMAILSHIHRNLPSTSSAPVLDHFECEERISLAEQCALGLEDFRSTYGKLAYFQGSQEEREAEREAYLSERLPRFLRAFEQLLVNNGGFYGKGKHLVGDELHWVDILLWDMLDVNLHESVGGRELLSEYPLLAAFYKNISEQPNISAYLQSDRRAKQAHGSSAWLGARA